MLDFESAGSADPLIGAALQRFSATGDVSHLDFAISHARRLTATSHLAERDAAFLLVAALLTLRARVTPGVDDINKALELFDRGSQRGSPEPDPSLLTLELQARLIRYDRAGDPRDLQACISRGAVIEARLPDGGTAALLRNYYGSALRLRFLAERDIADLHGAISLLRRAVSGSGAQLAWASAANNLAVALHDRFEARAADEDFSQALELTGKVKDLLTVTAAEKPALLPLLMEADCTRARLLATKWRFYGGAADIEEAIGTLQGRIAELDDQQPAAAAVITTLASILADVAVGNRDLAAAGDAVELSEIALDDGLLAPGTMAHDAAQRSYLAVLSDRASLADDFEGIDAALALQQALGGDGHHPLQALLDHNLAVLRILRFQAHHNADDAREALRLHERAAASEAVQGTEGDLILSCYATTHLTLYGHDGQLSHLPAARDLLQRATKRSSVTIRHIEALSLLADVGLEMRDWHQAVEAADRALHDIDSVVGALDLAHWDDWLRPAQGIAAVGAYGAAQLGDLTTAVELLERGCGIRAAGRLSRQSVTMRSARGAGFDSEVDDYEQAAGLVRQLLARQVAPTDTFDLSKPYVDHDDDELATAIGRLSAARLNLERRIGPIVPADTVSELVAFAVESDAELSYVAATFAGGLRLRARAGGSPQDSTLSSLAVEWLPELTDEAVIGWCERLHAQEIDPDAGDRTVPIRATVAVNASSDATAIVAELSAVRAWSRGALTVGSRPAVH